MRRVECNTLKPRTERWVPALLVLAIGVSMGCATTRQLRGVPDTSGFLGDYSMLRPGKGKEAGLVYFASDANFAGYDAVMIDSVTFWTNKPTKLSAKDRQMLTDYLYNALHDELQKDYRIADAPGPGVLRIRAAVTEAKGARVVANTITSVVPQARAVTTLAGAATNTALLVGRAAVEADITDSLSGRRLAAAVDERVGTKAVRGGILKWSDAKSAFDYWAERLRKRLAEERGS